MAAGGSAEQRADQQRQRALNLEQEATEARREADRYALAAATERRIAAMLSRLCTVGYFVMTDRRWPGSETANVDMVLVGPAGVFIVDPKCWAQVQVSGSTITHHGKRVDLTGLAGLGEELRRRLADLGLPPRELHVVAVLAGHRSLHVHDQGVEIVGERDVLRYITSRGDRLTGEQVEAVFTCLLTALPPMSRSSEVTRARLVPSPRAIPEVESPPLLSDEEIAELVHGGVERAPIEDWMTFLHPDQARLVRRPMAGPARVRGGAGTGKSVVALHRAAWLAYLQSGRSKPGRVLVTSHVKTVPSVMRELLRRLAPDVAQLVDFRSVHAVAWDLLQRKGIKPALGYPRQIDEQFERAWSRVAVAGPLASGRLSMDYWREEVAAVIKGRGLTDFTEYETLSRIGRRYPISVEQRRAVWQLFEEYQRLLRERRLWDFADMLIQAERVARDEAAGSLFSHVIVDEVQDVSGVGLRMLHALVGDAPDGLLLVGDGQQQIFVGGYSLAEAGIDVRGRSTVLRRNYRNTVQIIQAAREVVEGDTYADLDGREEPGERRIDAIRHGPEPIRMVAGSRTELDFALLDTLNRWRARPDMSLGDIAVLTLRNTDRQRLLRLLGRYGVPVIDLQGYRGATVDRVKVGTYHRAKGLEFKAVLLPMWNQVSLDRDAEPGCEIDATGGERRERDRRALFVAMTRARDELWLGSVRGPSGSG
jgi:hypothetical protein